METAKENPLRWYHGRGCLRASNACKSGITGGTKQNPHQGSPIDTPCTSSVQALLKSVWVCMQIHLMQASRAYHCVLAFFRCHRSVDARPRFLRCIPTTGYIPANERNSWCHHCFWVKIIIPRSYLSPATIIRPYFLLFFTFRRPQKQI